VFLLAELEAISGSGKDGRVTKEDILNYIAKNRGKSQPQLAQLQVASRNCRTQPVKQLPQLHNQQLNFRSVKARFL
jgi:2-oxoglutarate dehydrogenase E2 component (dihydrolipoamide succinyltransferase)